MPDELALRILAPGDEAMLEAFLRRHVDSSMILLSNLGRAGLEDRGAAYQATYAALLSGERIEAVAAHAWNGMLVIQAPAGAERVAPAAVARSGRRVAGLLGPRAQVQTAREALGLAAAPTTMDSHEDLFALDLGSLRVPAALAAGRWRSRPPRADELELAVQWAIAYQAETLGTPETPDLEAWTRERIGRLRAERSQWLLLVEDRPVAYSAFNARLPDMVQVGGVFTPPPLRGRGYGRAAVAGSLLAARGEGAGRAILFTGRDNAPAQRAYRGLGFEIVGDYAIVLFSA